MKKNLPVKSYLLRLCAVIALVGLIAYTLYHVAFSSEGSLMTTPSRKVTDTQTLTAKGYLFRHESVLYAEVEGLLYSLVSDGTKASKNTPLVEHRAQFSGGALATAQQKLDALCRSIAILEAGQSAVGAPLTQANDHRAEANALRISIKQMLGHTDRLSLAQSEDALLVALNRYAAVIGNDGAADALLNELRAERDALLSSPATVYYNTESSGRFYSRDFVDGYESLFTRPVAASDRQAQRTLSSGAIRIEPRKSAVSFMESALFPAPARRPQNCNCFVVVLGKGIL